MSASIASRVNAVRLIPLTALLTPASMVAHVWKALEPHSHAVALLTSLVPTAAAKFLSVLPKHASMEERAKRLLAPTSHVLAPTDTLETCVVKTTPAIEPVLLIHVRMVARAAKVLVQHSPAVVSEGLAIPTAL